MSRESREPDYRTNVPNNPRLDLYDKLKKEGELLIDGWNHERYVLDGLPYDVWFSKHGTLQEINLGR